MSFVDKTLSCRDCKQDFVFTSGEQAFYAEKGFENEPVRCPACRASRKQQRGSSSGQSARRMYAVTCSACGMETEVPFNPTNDRPVYCRSCFQNRY